MGNFEIPVIWRRSRHDRGSRFMLPVEELLFIRVANRELCFYSTLGEYFLHSFLDDWRILLEDRGFDELDRGALVNMTRISYIHSELRLVHFDTDTATPCPISQSQLIRVKSEYPHIPIR